MKKPFMGRGEKNRHQSPPFFLSAVTSKGGRRRKKKRSLKKGQQQNSVPFSAPFSFSVSDFLAVVILFVSFFCFCCNVAVVDVVVVLQTLFF